MTNQEITAIEEALGYTFHNTELLIDAFTHSSYANEHSVNSYERLEFLGDSILNMLVANYLFNRYPEADEGFLTKTRASIVSERTLAFVVEKLDLMQYVRTSVGSIENEVRRSTAVRCDIFESILGAIMLDSKGLEQCEILVLDKLKDMLNADYTLEKVSDYKSRLLEYGAHNALKVVFNVTPKKNGKVIESFVAYVYIDGAQYGSGEGTSKKKAEQFAARETLEMLRVE